MLNFVEWFFSAVFLFHSADMTYFIYWFVYIKPSLHHWQKSHLIIASDIFCVLLDSICSYFVENVCIPVLGKHC
jgi:hypothetical protein